MRKLLTVLSLLITLCSFAQTVTCHTDSVPVPFSTQMSDTIWYKSYEIVGTRDSIVYRLQCGKPCQLNIPKHKPHNVVDKIIQLPVYDSVQKFTVETLTITSLRDSFFRVCDTVYPVKTQHGVKLQGSDDSSVLVLKSLNLYWTRTGMILSRWDGNRLKDVDKYMAAGIKVMLNIKWVDTQDPQPFCRDTIIYAVKYRQLLTMYVAEAKAGKIVFLCENEPLNIGYYGLDPIENYIALCRIFVRISDEFGASTADGCSFVEYLDMIRTGTWPSRLALKISNQMKLIEAFKTIHFTYLNVHLTISDNSIKQGMIAQALAYLRAQTGRKEVITNEYHYYNCTSTTDIVNPSPIVFTVTDEWEKGEVLICVLWSGDTINGVSTGKSDAVGFSVGTKLTRMGLDLQQAVK